LPRWWLRVLYLLCMGLVFMLPISFFVAYTDFRVGLAARAVWDGFWVGLPFLIVAALLALRKIKPVEALRWTWIGYRKSALWLVPGFILLFGTGLMCSFGFNISNGLDNSLYVALLFVPLGILMLIIAGMGRYQVTEKTYPNQGIIQSAK